MKWNMVWSVSSLEMGGRTPRASQVRSTMFCGCLSDMQGIFVFSMYSIGYALEMDQFGSSIMCRY